MFSHDTKGGFFPDIEQAKSYNKDDPNADLYSILDQIEDYRKDGVFHIRLCYDELAEDNFPCNEWTQSSNFVEDPNITDFNAIDITFKQRGDGGMFGGIGLNSPENSGSTLIDDMPHSGNWWSAIGAISQHGTGLPGPHPTVVRKVELYLAISNSHKFIKTKIK